MINIVKTSLCGLILGHILNVVFAIPVTEFFPFGADTPGRTHKLFDGNNEFEEIFVTEPIRFYERPYDVVIVSKIV